MLFNYLQYLSLISWLRRAALTALLVGTSLVGWADNYYWVGGSGQWDDLSHWASSSGGRSAYEQVPQSTDNVYFDEKSFTASGQTVAIGATVTCHDLSWTGAVHTAGNSVVSGMRLVGGGTVEVTGNLRLAAGLGQQDVNFRLLASMDGQKIDLQAVAVNGWLSFESEAGGWTFVSDANLVQYGAMPSLLLAAGSVDFGRATITCFGVRSTGSRVRDIYLNASTFNLLAPVNTWEIGGTNLTLEAGASTLRLGATARSTANGYSFLSTTQAYNVVEIAAGASATLGVAGSTITTLSVKGIATLTSSATITGTLAIAPEAVLRAAGGQTLSLGSRATLLVNGSCAGLAQLQSSVPGVPATLQRAGSWSSTTLAYAAVQDVAFSGGGTATANNSLNRGGTTGIAFNELPVSDLYWVGGSGNWHDASHWASRSGGAGGGCLPTLATNVHFDSNSFTTSGQVVMLDGPNAFCRDLDWTGAAHAPTFSTAATDLGQKQLGIGGSLVLITSLAFRPKADLVFYGHEAGGRSATVTTAGQVLLGNVYFRAPGSTYTLRDALTLAPGMTSPNGRLYVEAGTFTTADQAITAQGFTSGYAATNSVFTTGTAAGGPVSAAAVRVQLGSSRLTLTPASGASDVGVRTTYTWDVAAGVVLDAGTSIIAIGSNATPNQPAFFRAGLGLTYSIVTFTDPAAASLPTVVAGSPAVATFGQLNFAGSANVSASNAFRQQLSLAAGRVYNFYNSTQTFGTNAQLLTGGDCSGYVTISGGTGTARVTFSKPAGDVPNPAVSYAALRNVTFAGGSQWTASQCFDNGGNTGIVFRNPPVPRTLYWVGNGGRWSDPSHWASSSGGIPGICVPNQLDAVVFDEQSFTSPGQTVTQDAVLATCRSLSWAAATNAPTFSGVAANRLAISGSLTWSAAMRQLLLGETLLLGSGTLTSAGQPFGGALTINAPGATISLADALRQLRTSGRGLTLTAGTLLTNDQSMQLRSLTSAAPDGEASATPPARTLRIGASLVELTAGAWTLSQPASLTFDAGTSTILLSTGTAFNGNGFTYNVVQTGAGASHTVGGSGSTIARLQLAGVNYVTGSNTITQQLTLAPGSTYQFGAGTTTTFADGATVQATGTGAQVITLQSTVSGQAFSWRKLSGTICASYIYLRDSNAQGGAYFEAGQNANNQGNTTGWSFASLPQASYASQQVCPQLGAHVLRLTFTGLDRLTRQPTTLAAAQFPLTVVVKSLTTNTTETLTVAEATYDYPVLTSTGPQQYQVLSVATNSANCLALTNSGPFDIVTDSPLNGPAGQWTGRGATASWLDCQNWASGTVPTATTDVTVGATAVPPVLNAAGAAVGTLRIEAGGQLTLGSAAKLVVGGHWLNEGSTFITADSEVSFIGADNQLIAGGSFGRVLVNNAAGLTLQGDATSATSLTLVAGAVRTGSYKWVHTNPAGNSLTTSGSSYVVGTLRRYLAAGSADAHVFPVGTASQYARLDVLSSQLAGTHYLDASFAPLTDAGAGLTCADTSPSALRYVALHPAGRWLLRPDAQPTGGTYAVRAYLFPFGDLADNLFGILMRPETSTSAADWTTGGGTLSPADGEGRRVADSYALRSGLSSFGQVGLGQAEAATPLPVRLVSFRAVPQGASVLLTWVVAQERGLSRYVVERSLDGHSFQAVGQASARGGASARYSFLDKQVTQPSVNQYLYYRLRLEEPGVPAVYSPLSAVQVLALAPALVTWPTRFSAELHIDGRSLSEDLQRLELTDVQGRVVYAQMLPPGTRVATLSGLELATGLYLLRATTATQLHQQRVVKE